MSQECVRCVLDETITNISFDEDGLCNYCKNYDLEARPILENKGNLEALEKKVEEIKAKGKGKRYDCLIGLSGGVDSSYVAHFLAERGLRPLAFHLDNGWNSDISVKNIKNIVSRLGIDLYTHVIDWDEFKDMQLAFLKAGVVDVELLTDHAITAVAYKLIRKEKIKYFISGSNYATEAIMPNEWSYYKWDSKNIKSIHRMFGKQPIKTYPSYNFIDKIKSQSIYEVVRVLDYIEYNKEDAMKLLKDKLGWQYYGGKHYESIFTKFYQAYILPNKFGIDKRKPHVSSLINSGQFTKEQAYEELSHPLYPSEEEKEKDIEYILKKFNLSRTEFDKIISDPPKSHLDYPNGVAMNNLLKKVKRTLLGK